MNILQSFSCDYVLVELTCADTAEALRAYGEKGIRIQKPKLKSSLILQFWLPANQQNELLLLAKKRGEQCSFLEKTGRNTTIKRVRKRIPFLTVLFVILILGLLASKRVWFLRVEGNIHLHDREILAAAEECGLRFWTKASLIQNQEFKDKLLSRITQLQWAGINFSGGIATLCVQEKLPGEDGSNTDGLVDVIASRDGLLVSMDVLQGQALYQPGQAVKAGEILVTGCVEHEYQSQLVCADAEVYALTQREIRAVFPISWDLKESTGIKKRCISLILGRNKIKIFGNSSIYGVTCDKMTTVKELTLPGGFCLPFSVAIEEIWPYGLVHNDRKQEWERQITLCLDNYVQEDMIAGEILERKFQWNEQDDCCEIYAVYSCREMIARQKKVLGFEGECTNDRTNGKRGASGGSD